MKELIVGNGFIGRAAYEKFTQDGKHEVHQASRRPNDRDMNSHRVDLGDPDSIAQVLDDIRPNVIINCAAVLGRNPADDVYQNEVYTRNLLGAAADADLDLSRVVILGSAAEYGPVEEDDLPIYEDAPLNPSNPYGKSKRDEVQAALELADGHGLPIAVGRIFNPLGPGLHPSNLTSRVLGQVKAIQDGEQHRVIEVRNLEAARDYLHVSDCVNALGILAHTGELPYRVYNIGSGERTSNREVIQAVLRHTGMQDVEVRATDGTPEQLVGAVQANITRIRKLGYGVSHTIDQTVAEMVADAGMTANNHQS